MPICERIVQIYFVSLFAKSSGHSGNNRARLLERVTVYHRLMIGRDGHLNQSEDYNIL